MKTSSGSKFGGHDYYSEKLPEHFFRISGVSIKARNQRFTAAYRTSHYRLLHRTGSRVQWFSPCGQMPITPSAAASNEKVIKTPESTGNKVWAEELTTILPIALK